MRSVAADAVLLIAYHYPPCGVSSGLQRTLAFSRHLRSHGWQPVVLTVRASAYERTSTSQLSDIPEGTPVARTFALDAARDLAIRGRYWSRLALPDRWSSWWLTGVASGLHLIHKYDVRAIWSTYPIATAHRIGSTLARLTRRPWIADFRDPMVERHPLTGDWAPRDLRLRTSRLAIESAVVRSASRLIFCTQAARDIVANRYSHLDADRLQVIPNGYDEQVFADAEKLQRPARDAGRRLLLHSGVVYPGADRDPTALFRALKILLDEGLVAPDNFELRLRDPSREDYFRRLADTQGVGALVTITPALAYREALSEMLGADGLLLLQGITSNPAVPAKLYEYLRAGRPIIPLVHPEGETARTLREAGIHTSAPLTDTPEIAALLRAWIDAAGTRGFGVASAQSIAMFARDRLTARLVATLDEVRDRGRD